MAMTWKRVIACVTGVLLLASMALAVIGAELVQVDSNRDLRSLALYAGLAVVRASSDLPIEFKTLEYPERVDSIFGKFQDVADLTEEFFQIARSENANDVIRMYAAIGAAPTQREELVPLIEKGTRHHAQPIREASVTSLRWFHSFKTLRLCVAALRDSSARVRERALAVLVIRTGVNRGTSPAVWEDWLETEMPERGMSSQVRCTSTSGNTAEIGKSTPSSP